MNPKVDAFLENEKKWRAEMVKLRSICLSTGLTEDFKWGQPCYTEGGKNVAIIHGFKEYCAILFVKGALLKDPEGILVHQTENVQAGRQVRFTGLPDIAKREGSIAAYLREAIAVERSGAKVPKKNTADFAVPEEFERALAENAVLKEAFEALTPGRQRAYLLYFAGAKQAKTREARIEKCEPRILDGLGLDD